MDGLSFLILKNWNYDESRITIVSVKLRQEVKVKVTYRASKGKQGRQRVPLPVSQGLVTGACTQNQRSEMLGVAQVG